MRAREASCVITRQGVVAVVGVLAAAPVSFALRDGVVTLALDGGAPGPSFRPGPLSLSRIERGDGLVVMEMDGGGPARATAVDRR